MDPTITMLNSFSIIMTHIAIRKTILLKKQFNQSNPPPWIPDWLDWLSVLRAMNPEPHP